MRKVRLVLLLITGCKSEKDHAQTAEPVVRHHSAAKIAKVSPETEDFKLFQNIKQFTSASIFQIIADRALGGDEHRYFMGNAFLVNDNVLVTAAHIFRQAGANYKIIIVKDGALIPAKLALSDSNDIAIVEASVPGQPLKIRGARSDENNFYLAGVWSVFTKNVIFGYSYIHEVRGWPDEDGFKFLGKSTMPVAGVFAHGLSGSPLLGLDGKVVGVFSTVIDICIARDKKSPSLGGIVKAGDIAATLAKYYNGKNSKTK